MNIYIMERKNDIYYKKYIKYNKKVSLYKNLHGGSWPSFNLTNKHGNERARRFADSIKNEHFNNKVIFTHGKFIRKVIEEFIPINDGNFENSYTSNSGHEINIFSGIPKSELAYCAGFSEDKIQKIQNKSTEKGKLYQLIGNGAIINIKKGDYTMFMVRHFPSVGNLNDIMGNTLAKFSKNPPLIKGKCLKNFINKYKELLKGYDYNNLKNLIKNVENIYVSCSRRTHQTADNLIRLLYNLPLSSEYKILKGIHEIGKLDPANKCPDNTNFDKVDFMGIQLP